MGVRFGRWVFGPLVVAAVTITPIPASSARSAPEKNQKPALMAFDVDDGTVLWTERSVPSGSFVRVAFASGGKVFVDEVKCSGRVEPVDPGGAVFAAYAGETGQRVWERPVRAVAVARGPLVFVEDYASRFGAGLPVGVVERDGRLAGLAAKNGSVRWRAATGDLSPVGGSASLVVLGPYAVGGLPQGRGEVRAVDRRNGRVRWKFALGQSEVLAAPVLADRTTVAVLTAQLTTTEQAESGLFGGVRDFELHAIDARTGTVRWQRRTRQPDGAGLVSIAPIVFGQDDGLVAYDPASGAELWRAPGAAPFARSAVGGLIVAGRPNADQVAVDASNGTTRWSAGQHELVTPAASNAETIAAASYGRVVALDARTGLQRWAADAPIGETSVAVDGRTVYAGGGCDPDDG